MVVAPVSGMVVDDGCCDDVFCTTIGAFATGVAMVMTFGFLVGVGVAFDLKIEPREPFKDFLSFATRDKPTPMSKITTNNPTNNANTLLVLSI